MTNLDSVLKSRGITLPTKVRLVRAMVFPVVMYGCESWTIKKAEHWRIDAFELWCWRRLLRVPWAARRSNQLILKEINPEYSLEGLMLKLPYLGHLMWRANSLEKTLLLGRLEGRRRRGQQRIVLLCVLAIYNEKINIKNNIIHKSVQKSQMQEEMWRKTSMNYTHTHTHTKTGTSLVAQWLGVCTFTAEGAV